MPSTSTTLSNTYLLGFGVGGVGGVGGAVFRDHPMLTGILFQPHHQIPTVRVLGWVGSLGLGLGTIQCLEGFYFNIIIKYLPLGFWGRWAWV